MLIANADTYILLAAFFGFLMACGIGANDVSNAIGTSVGSKAITIRQAMIIATIFEFLGATFAGGKVISTISSGIINLNIITDHAEIFILGMLASLLASGAWLILATAQGWPVSTTHTIVGAILGFGLNKFGASAIKWKVLNSIFISWIISPIVGGVIAYIIFYSIQKVVLSSDNPIKAAKKYIPIYIFVVGWIISMTIIKCFLNDLHITLAVSMQALYALISSTILTIIGKSILHKLKLTDDANTTFHLVNVEKMFSVLMLFTGCAMAFAHGSNDVANAIGPLAAVYNIINNEYIGNIVLPLWIVLIGSGGIILGLLTYGHKVIATIGSGITELTPIRGFAATASAAFTVIVASDIGLPISTTHTLVGAILGIGLARGIGALNLKNIRNIFLSWCTTVPAGAMLSITFYRILERLFL